MRSSCCLPSRGSAGPRLDEAVPRSGSPHPDRIQVPGARIAVGTADPIHEVDGEAPARRVVVRPFAIDAAAVTNRRFAEFVDLTGYRTDAEAIGWSFVFASSLKDPERLASVPESPWWRQVFGADWRRPEGEGSSLESREEDPVVHISFNDAFAFARWCGGRLPTEAEWEYAARGSPEPRRYPWGDREPDDRDFQPCNIWQGTFPTKNTGQDGYIGTAPAKSFEPNEIGLYNVVGNTWEWCADPFRIRSLKTAAKRVDAQSRKGGLRVVKGGSYLCHRSYCHRYRIAARRGNAPQDASGHLGFRVAYDGTLPITSAMH